MLCGVLTPMTFILALISEVPGVEEVEGASPDFVELAGVGNDCLVDRRGGMAVSKWGANRYAY